MKKEIAYLTMVKDEEDTIYWHLKHYRNMGIRYFYILENNSTDQTVPLIYRFQKEHLDCFIRIIPDKDIRYYQSIKMTQVAEYIYSQGIKYILPVDADEILIHDDLQLLAEQLDTPGIGHISWRWYHPTEKDNYLQGNPFLRIQHREAKHHELPKCMIHWTKGMVIWQGNHGIENRTKYKFVEFTGDPYFAHFSWRSKDHTRKKIQNFGKAYEQIRDWFIHEMSNENWEKYKVEGEAYIERYWAGLEKKSAELEHFPLSPTLFA